MCIIFSAVIRIAELEACFDLIEVLVDEWMDDVDEDEDNKDIWMDIYMCVCVHVLFSIVWFTRHQLSIWVGPGFPRPLTRFRDSYSCFSLPYLIPPHPFYYSLS